MLHNEKSKVEASCLGVMKVSDKSLVQPLLYDEQGREKIDPTLATALTVYETLI